MQWFSFLCESFSFENDAAAVIWIGESDFLMKSLGCPSSSSATKQAEDWILLGHEPTAPSWMPAALLRTTS
jgi:hypothetical protein